MNTEKLITAEEAASLLAEVLNVLTGNMVGKEPMPSRDCMTEEVAKRCAERGFRFSTDFRHETTPVHALIYHLISPVRANSIADRLSGVTTH